MLVCLLVSVVALLPLVSCQMCDRITINDLGNPDTAMATGLISEALTPSGQGSTGPSVRVLEINIVCEAQAGNRNRYRFTSVVASFNCSSTDVRITPCLNMSVVNIMQFDLACDNANTWITTSLGSDSFVLTESPTATLSTDLDSQCAACVNPNHNIVVAATTPIANDTHCQGCVGCVGLGRCLSFNNNPSQCCNYYDNDVCVTECPSPLVPNTNFECGCTILSDSNGNIVFTNNQTNGSVATLTCNTGYELSGAGSATCTVNGWLANLTCTPVQCMDLESINDGEIAYSDETNFNSTATYTCISGFELLGEATRTCLADMTWSGMEPNCTMLMVPVPVECDVGCIIGIVVGVLLLILLIIVVIIIAVVLCTKYMGSDSKASPRVSTTEMKDV